MHGKLINKIYMYYILSLAKLKFFIFINLFLFWLSKEERVKIIFNLILGCFNM